MRSATRFGSGIDGALRRDPASPGARAQRVTLRLDIGPGDQGEPVATIGFPEDF